MLSPGRDESNAEWDRFWSSKTLNHTLAQEDDKTWHALVWKVACEFWYGVFERIAPGTTMLEYGCGSANVSQYMAGRGYQCTMLDYSRTALAVARSNLQEHGLNGRFIVSDINRLGLAESQFDIVYSGGVLEFFRDPQVPIFEAVRALKPGGLFAANMVPNKLSVQSIADIERTLAGSAKRLWQRRWGEVFRVVRNVHPDVSKYSLRDYVRCCQAAGLTSISARCTSPFPAWSLGSWGEMCYGKLLKRLLRQWYRFNESKSHWTELWGITYMIYGLKSTGQ